MIVGRQRYASCFRLFRFEASRRNKIGRRSDSNRDRSDDLSRTDPIHQGGGPYCKSRVKKWQKKWQDKFVFHWHHVAEPGEPYVVTNFFNGRYNFTKSYLVSRYLVQCTRNICIIRGKSFLESWVTTFLPEWQLPLIFIRFISNFLWICSNSVDSAHAIFRQVRQRLRVAAIREEKW